MFEALVLALVPASAALQQSTDDRRAREARGVDRGPRREIERRYVFADVAQQYGAKLRERLYAGAYEGVSDPDAREPP
jgi:hypothetical protein